MKEVFKKYVEKTGIDINTIFFIYNKYKIINDELTIEQISNENDKLINFIKILVSPITKFEQISSIINTKEVICPKCGELSIFNINNYKIYFYECKNGHKIDNIFFQ